MKNSKYWNPPAIGSEVVFEDGRRLTVERFDVDNTRTDGGGPCCRYRDSYGIPMIRFLTEENELNGWFRRVSKEPIFKSPPRPQLEDHGTNLRTKTQEELEAERLKVENASLKAENDKLKAESFPSASKKCLEELTRYLNDQQYARRYPGQVYPGKDIASAALIVLQQLEYECAELENERLKARPRCSEVDVDYMSDLIEDAFYAGRFQEDDRDNSKDWRRAAICVLDHLGILKIEEIEE
jgi:hypothetical protein